MRSSLYSPSLLAVSALVWLGSACDLSDPMNHIEHGMILDEPFSFRVSKPLSVQCTDDEGVDWLYVHAASSGGAGGCDGGGDVGDVSGLPIVDYTCDGIDGAIHDPLAGDTYIRCGIGHALIRRKHQVSLWFRDYDPAWPTEATFSNGQYDTCLGRDTSPVPDGVNTQINHAWFLPDPEATELFVTGPLHGVLDVKHCD